MSAELAAILAGFVALGVFAEWRLARTFNALAASIDGLETRLTGFPGVNRRAAGISRDTKKNGDDLLDVRRHQIAMRQ
jgi:hypothetical protein